MKQAIYLLIVCSLLMAVPGIAQTIPHKKPIAGIFDGRSPCHALAAMLQEPIREECIKIKWRLILYKDEAGNPDGYQLWGFVYRNNEPREGQWHITKGTNTNPDATVYQLDLSGKPSLMLHQADGNVLFFLDANKNLLVGNRDFSYTLNRVNKADELRIMAAAK